MATPIIDDALIAKPPHNNIDSSEDTSSHPTTLLEDMRARLAKLEREKYDLETKLTILNPPTNLANRIAERRLREIALRNYDHALARGWSVDDSPEVRERALLLDLARLEQDVMRLQYRARMSREFPPIAGAPPSSSTLDNRHPEEPARSLEEELNDVTKPHILTVYLGKRGAREFLEIDRRVFPDVTCGEIVKKACVYWNLPRSEYALVDAQGITWPSRSRVPGDAKFVVLCKTERLLASHLPSATPTTDLDVISPENSDAPSPIKSVQQDEEEEEEDDDDDHHHLNGPPSSGGPPPLSPEEESRIAAAVAVPMLLNRKPRGARKGCAKLIRRFAMIYVLAVAAVFVVGVLDYRGVMNSYRAYNGVRRAWGDASWTDSRGTVVENFLEIDTLDRVWDWLLGPSTTYLAERNSSSPFILGGIQVSQLRVKPDATCTVASSLLSSSTASRSCYAAVSSGSVLEDASSSSVSPFIYQSPRNDLLWPTLTGSGNPMVNGRYAVYPLEGFGFLTESRDPLALRASLLSLRNQSWINENSTRAVMLSVTLYSPPAGNDPGVFLTVVALFELFPGAVTGGVSSKWIAVGYADAIRGASAFDVALTVLICVYCAWDTFYLSSKKRRGGWLYVRISVDVALFIFAILYAVGNAQLRASLSNAAALTLSSTPPPFVDYRVVATQFELTGNLAGVVAALLAFETLIPGLEASNKFRAISHTASLLVGRFTALLVFVALAGTVWALAVGHFVFGTNPSGLSWSLVDVAYANLWNFMTPAFPTSYYHHPIVSWGFIVFAILVFLTFWVVANWLFFAVISHAYVTVQDRVRKEGSAVALDPHAYYGYGEERSKRDDDDNDDQDLDEGDDSNDEAGEERRRTRLMSRLVEVEEASGKVDGPGAAYLQRVFRGAAREFA